MKLSFLYFQHFVLGYFQQFAMLNQMVTMCQQLNSDIFNLTNHKYIAHQTALLYVSIQYVYEP